VRGWIIAGVTIAVVAAGAATAFVVTDGDGDPAAASDGAPTTQARQLVTVERTDLRRTETFNGTTGHGEPRPLVLAADGTLTQLPAAGDVIESGQTIAEIDGRPVVALQGELPMWRALGPSAADGKDIVQLEYALAVLGYAEKYDVTVDEDWTSATTRAVKAFQADHGQDDDGTIDVGDIVWIDGPSRVDSVKGVVGQPAADAGIEITGTAQTVHLAVDVDKAELLPVGATVQVELPSGQTVDGTVATVGTVETGDDGSTSIPVDVTMAGGTDVPDGMPVDVHATTVAAPGVLAVPVEALLALAGGGYALEVADGDGGTHLVKVTLGEFADDKVAVSGDVEAGDQVVTP
jgi:peptidoglycan hydrolase-like protein with peptidoglycan-binding domain